MGASGDFLMVGALAFVFSVFVFAALRRRLLERVLAVQFFAAFEPIIRFIYWTFVAIVVVVDVLLLTALGLNLLLVTRK